jgi:uncharacterized RDD family membrane protein YckC
MSGILLGSLVLPAVLFGVVYYPTLNKFARGLASPYAKADIGRRFCAVLVDSLLVMTGWFFYRQFESVLYLLVALVYVLLRDSTFGRSIGKFLFGLVVIDLETGCPCGRGGSARRNVLFLLPGANLSAAFLEAVTIMRDPQGQRLGDRIAQTQVVEGFGARDLAAGFQRWWRDFIAQLDGTPQRPRRVPGRINDANP